MKKLLLLTTFFAILTGLVSIQTAIAAEGDSFDTPITLSDTGTVNFPVDIELLYYSYTLTENKVLVISAIESYNVDVYDAAENTIDYTLDGQRKYNLEAGTYIIKIENPHDDLRAFDWILSIHDLLPGEFPENAIELTDTCTVNFPLNREQLYYTYTLTENKVMVISEEENGYYSSVYWNRDILDYAYSGQRKYNLGAGTFIIRIDNLHDDLRAFDWTLSIHDLLPGEFPENAIELTETGTVTIPEGMRDVYYTFTAEEDGFLCAKNINWTFYLTDDETSSGIIIDDTHDNGFSHEIKYGEKYHLLIDVEDKTGASWNFIIADGHGLSCNLPIVLNNYTAVTTKIGVGRTYYKFTAPEEGAIKIESDGVSSVALYTNCGTYDEAGNSSLAYSPEGKVSYFASEGEIFYIIWNTYSPNIYSTDEFLWSITKTVIPGFDCNSPILVETAGDVVYPEGNEYLFYSYTATKDCRLVISNGDTNDEKVEWYDCESGQYFKTGDYGEMTIFATEGETYILKWQGEYYSRAEFTWNISEVDFTGGETCENAIEISVAGDVDFNEPQCALYYKYTPTINGFLILSSSTSNDIELYHDCYGYYFDNSNGEIKAEVKADEAVIIKWVNDNTEPFTWNISEEAGDEGEVCTNPIVISSLGTETEPTNFTTSIRFGYTYYSYTPTETKVLVISDPDGHKTAHISLDCNFDYNAQYSESGKLTAKVEANTTYIIRWENQSPADFTWEGFLRDAVEGEVYAPIELTEAGTVEYPAGKESVYYTYTATSEVVVSFETEHSGAYANLGSPRPLSTGEKFVFAWNNAAADAFSWTFGIRDIKNGETCSKAIEITAAGTFTCPAEFEETFYSFTPSNNVTVGLTDNTLETIVFIHEGCNYSSYYRSRLGEIAFEALAGKKYIINWSNNNSAIEFTFSENAPSEGESASTAKAIEPVGDIDYIGLEKGLVRNYYSYSPTSSSALKLGNMEYLLITNEATSDTLAEEWYPDNDYTFNFNKEVGYIFAVERGNHSSDNTWNFSGNTSNVTPNIKLQITAYGQAIEGATININQQTLTSDNNGYANIDLASNTYSYTVTASGYITETAEITVTDLDQIITVSLLSTNDAYRLVNFKVTANDEPIEDARIEIGNEYLVTDVTGYASFEFAGTQNYTVEASGYNTYNGSFTIDTEKEAQNISISLTEAGTSEYTVTFSVVSDTEKLKNVVININNNEILTTNAEGVATINLPNGVYDCIAALNGYEDYTVQITVADANEDVEIEMIAVEPDKYTVTFTAVSETENLQSVAISINSETLTTNAEGVATIDLPNGAYDFTATLNGYNDYTAQVTVADANEDVAIEMIAVTPDKYTVTFSVESETKKIANAVISINSEALNTDAEGIATIELSDGTYNYTVNADSYNEFTGDVTIAGANKNIDVELTIISSIANNDVVRINVYPNPIKDQLYISTDQRILSITLFNLSGVRIKTLTGVNALNTEGLSSGIYFLQIKLESGVITKRIVKE